VREALESQPEGWPSFNRSTRETLARHSVFVDNLESKEVQNEATQKGLTIGEASTHDSCRAGFAPAEKWRLVTAHHNHPLPGSAAAAARICVGDAACRARLAIAPSERLQSTNARHCSDST